MRAGILIGTVRKFILLEFCFEYQYAIAYFMKRTSVINMEVKIIKKNLKDTESCIKILFRNINNQYSSIIYNLETFDILS